MQTSYSFEAIGTRWQIDIENPVTLPERILEAVINRCEFFDKTYSRFRSDSLVTKMAKHAGVYRMPDDFIQLYSLYHALYELTDGAFTPLIGSVLSQAGYDAKYTFKRQVLQKPPIWKDTLNYTYPFITLQKAALLDFGAAGKGYLIDILGRILKKNRIHAFTIDAGGDILVKNTSTNFLRVGLEHPKNPKQVIGIAEIRNQSICASSGNRRKWKNFHHIINPHTLTSPGHIISTFVIAQKAMYADALATSLFFVPAKKLLTKYNFTYALVYKDHSLEAAPDFPAEFYLRNNMMVA